MKLDVNCIVGKSPKVLISITRIESTRPLKREICKPGTMVLKLHVPRFRNPSLQSSNFNFQAAVMRANMPGASQKAASELEENYFD